MWSLLYGKYLYDLCRREVFAGRYVRVCKKSFLIQRRWSYRLGIYERDIEEDGIFFGCMAETG